MKKTILLCVFTLLVYNVCAQKIIESFSFNINGIFKEKYEEFEAGTPFNLNRLVKVQKTNENESLMACVIVNSVQVGIPYSLMKVLDLKPTDNQSFWECEALQNDVYQTFLNKGYQYDVRQDLNEEASDYLKDLSNSHLLYEDPYTEDYVNALFASVIYQNFNDKRLGTLNVYILKSLTPDSYMLPNGSLIISTGLLSTLDSAEELTAIMSSEVAHYVLDHALINVNKEVAREKRAAFWGSVASGVLSATEDYLTVKNEYYVPGTATLAVALVSSAIFNKASQRMGMTYSRAQEKSADQCAMEYLTLKNIDPSALPSALSKIKKYYEDHRDFYTLSKYGSYAELDQRIERLGKVNEFVSHPYNKAMSGVNTFNAILLLNNKRYADAAILVNKNIEQKVATDDDYILLAKSNMGMYNTEEKNNESLSLIQKAKSIAEVPNLNTSKQEILVLLRLNKQAKAAAALQEYIDHLAKFQDQTRSSDDATWASSESNWANKLLQRINIL